MKERKKIYMVHERQAEYGAKKPVICTKCKRGRIGSISKGSRIDILRNGKLPPDNYDTGLTVKCVVCGTYWTFIHEN